MDVLTVAFSPAMIVWTCLFIAVVCFWGISLVGLLDIDVLDGGDLEVDGDVDADVEGDVSGHHHTAGDGTLVSSMGSFLRVGKVPLTIILSILITIIWVLAMILNLLLQGYISTWSFIGVVVFFLGSGAGLFFVGVFLTGVVTGPLAKVFENRTTHGAIHLLGRECVMKSSDHTNGKGQAELKVDDSYLLIQVELDPETSLKRGDVAIITGYDADRHVYQVTDRTVLNPS